MQELRASVLDYPIEFSDITERHMINITRAMDINQDGVRNMGDYLCGLIELTNLSLSTALVKLERL